MKYLTFSLQRFTISTRLENSMTYFSPASIAPPRTGTGVAVLGLWGPGGCITVTGTPSVFILADHNSVLNTSSTAAGALTRIKHTLWMPHHEVTQRKKKKKPVSGLRLKIPLTSIIWVEKNLPKTWVYWNALYSKVCKSQCSPVLSVK